jgi:YfiH family protein
VPGIAVGVETADCVPVLLFDPVKPAVAAVHAGWKSTVKKIVQKAVHRMHEEFGSEPARLIAAIGPAIGPECYEVDERVMERVRDSFSFWREVSTPRGTDHWSLDLGQTNGATKITVEQHAHTLDSARHAGGILSFSAEAQDRQTLSVIT